MSYGETDPVVTHDGCDHVPGYEQAAINRAHAQPPDPDGLVDAPPPRLALRGYSAPGVPLG